MEPSRSEAKLNVLVVDDNDCVREVLTALLSRKGHRCESATNGVEVMVKVTQSRFDVVVTDVLMPKMDGITLTRKLTQNFSHLPVIVMTAQLDEDSAETAFMAGARDVISKPFEISEFMVRLHKMLDIKNLNGERRA